MRFVIVTAVFLFLLPPAFGVRSTNLQGFTQTTWKAENGLPDQRIMAFAQAKDGTLWIGTAEGLLRFDGVRFRTYGPNVAPTSLQRGVSCLLVTRNGDLWIGTDGGGVIRYRNGGFRSIPSEDGAADQFVRSIFQDRAGNIWIGADQGLFRVHGDSMEKLDGMNAVPSLFVRPIIEDQQGRIWVGGNALLEFEQGAFVRQHPFPGGLLQNIITAMYSSPRGAIWVGTDSGLYRLMSSGEVIKIPGISAQVSSLWQTADGRLWIGTVGHGLFCMWKHRLSHIASEELPSETIHAIFGDREGNLWLGTEAGLVRLSRSPVSIVPLPGGSDSTFETIAKGDGRTVWMASSGQLFRISGDVARPYKLAKFLHLHVRTAIQGKRGGLWIGTSGAGLLHVRNHRVMRFGLSNGLINDFVRVILIAKDGSVWVGTDGGLTHIRVGGQLRNYDTNHGLAYTSVTAIFEDRSRDIWVGTSRGVTELVRGQVVHNQVTRALKSKELWSICQDASGELWFATSNGLYGMKDGHLVHITKEQGLPSNIIYSILTDSKGNIWLSSPNSICRVRASQLDHLKSNTSIALTFYVNSVNMNSAQLYGGLQPEGVVSANGDVWFPSNKGAVHISVNKIVPSSPSPIRIESVIANGRPLPLNRKIVLPPGNARLQISYAVIDLGPQEAFRYRYKMGDHGSWDEAQRRRTAYYTHIPPGEYRFRVQAFELGNPRAVSEASILVKQEPHLYERPWFIICCLLIFSGAVFSIYRLRLHQMRLRLNAVHEERTRVAREMHDTVIQGCVGVSSLLEAALGMEGSEEPRRLQLLDYATEQIRSTIDSARNAIWALRGAPALGGDFGALCVEFSRQLQADSGIPVYCSVTGSPYQLPPSAAHELLMIVKEALTNALLHSRPTRLDVSLRFGRTGLTVEIQDDGCGFPSVEDSRGSGHYGIVGMKERVRLLRGEVRIDSESGHGTKVTVRVPRTRWAVILFGVLDGKGRSDED
jgi:ligand-binding sensor domain-containing protein/anti-sigma regulatory factor (Ser/Thr protein kinase)